MIFDFKWLKVVEIKEHKICCYKDCVENKYFLVVFTKHQPKAKEPLQIELIECDDDAALDFLYKNFKEEQAVKYLERNAEQEKKNKFLS